MIHCANCGLERSGDTCDHCGLGPVEAGRAMHRSLVNRLGVFLLGTIAFFVPCFMYPPLELDSILIFIGVLFFATIALAILAERRAIRHQEVETLKRIFYGFVPLPWILGMILDRKSTRLNSSHSSISYAVFCLKKKKIHNIMHKI